MAEQDEELITDPVFEELITDIGDRYDAVESQANSTLQLTTAEVYERLQDIYPSRTYTLGQVYSALKQLGFSYVDVTGEMNYKWLFMQR